MKEKIARWYALGLWSAEMVRNAVLKGVLTEDEAASILNRCDTAAGSDAI